MPISFKIRVKLYTYLVFTGLDPFVYQSGSFSAKRTRMPKRSSKVLRFSLVNADDNVVKTTPLSGLIMIPSWRRDEHIILPLVTVPANLSESSIRCSLIKRNLISIEKSDN